jgi:hypothetical protein
MFVFVCHADIEITRGWHFYVLPQQTSQESSWGEPHVRPASPRTAPRRPLPEGVLQNRYKVADSSTEDDEARVAELLDETARDAGTSLLTERHRSRTCPASGYDASLVLKTSWATGPGRSVAECIPRGSDARACACAAERCALPPRCASEPRASRGCARCACARCAARPRGPLRSRATSCLRPRGLWTSPSARARVIGTLRSRARPRTRRSSTDGCRRCGERSR